MSEPTGDDFPPAPPDLVRLARERLRQAEETPLHVHMPDAALISALAAEIERLKAQLDQREGPSNDWTWGVR